MKGYTSVSQLRSFELKSAAEVLGLTDVLYLDYRDSGMPGWKDNKHPNSLVSAPLDEVTGRIVAVFRRLKPDVVITFDPVGGSHHPDHIVIHKATVKAFYASGDEKQYPEAGKTFQPKKLYFFVYPLRLLRIMVRILTFFGRDMSIAGRNKEIDVAGWLGPGKTSAYAIMNFDSDIEIADLACGPGTGGKTPAAPHGRAPRRVGSSDTHRSAG